MTLGVLSKGRRAQPQCAESESSLQDDSAHVTRAGAEGTIRLEALQELRGEGLIGLTRSFQYAGARSVASTLWSASDQATAELMVRFYQHLDAGSSKDEALRAAQIELLRGPVINRGEDEKATDLDFTEPFYWAGFQLYGDWQ